VGRWLTTRTDVDESTPIPTLDEALHTALVNRPDLKAGQIGVQVSTLDARLAKEQAEPQISLTAQLETQGLAGRVLPQTNSVFGSIFTGLFTQVNELLALAGLPPLSTSALTSSTKVPSFFVGGYGKSLQKPSRRSLSDGEDRDSTVAAY
jgi:5-carboxymethyl-2-hydroxymuconate isomerase